MLDLLFLLSLLIPLPFWLLMIFLPRHSFTRRLVNNFWVFVILGAMYLFGLVGGTIAAIGQGASLFAGLTSLSGFSALVKVPAVALLVWLHMVTMDLAGGFLIYREATKQNMPTIFTSVCLFLTLLLGPLGMFTFAMWYSLTHLRKTAEISASSVVRTEQTA
jgi:hypothetical protein